MYMNYTEDTAKRYKDELMRIYRSNNPQGTSAPSVRPAQSTQMQNSATARQAQPMTPMQPVQPVQPTNPRQPATPMQPVSPARNGTMTQPPTYASEPIPTPPDVSLPPRTQNRPARSVQQPQQVREPDNSSAESYPFLLPERNQTVQNTAVKPSSNGRNLEYSDYSPSGGEKFTAPTSRAQTTKRRTSAQTKRNGSTVRNVNGNANNSYNDSRADARSEPVAEATRSSSDVRSAADVRRRGDVPAQSSEAQRRNGSEPSGSQSGLLMVEVSTAGGAVPLDGAFVTVTRRTDSGTSLVSMLTSDISGRTRTIELPAPDRSQSLSPDSGNTDKPFSTYTIRADKEGFYSVINVDVPVFSGVKSIQPVEMIPLPEYTPVPSPIEYINEEPNL